MSAAAEVILGARCGTVLSVVGLDAPTLRRLIDQMEPTDTAPRALIAPLRPTLAACTIADQLLDLLARTALKLWPLWFADVSFDQCRDDTLGRLAASAIARTAAGTIAGLSPAWAEAAARLALAGRRPRVRGTSQATELGQLARLVSPAGLVLVADLGEVDPAAPEAAAVVHALEWAARHLPGAVVALFAELPPNAPPFDRILHGALHVAEPEPGALSTEVTVGAADGPWLGPWRGQPHPMSEIEQRLARMLGADAELGPLFGFNLFVETVRGGRPKVDLLWAEGRLVVELDGYGDHNTRRAFVGDRHRDYELTLSGYTVLRLANDEVVQDYGRAIEKIRDLVRLRRAQQPLEG